MRSKDGILKVAGQIDLMIKDGNDIYLTDYKTSHEIKKVAYYDKIKKKKDTMLFPLDNLDNTNY
jgi:ATP-dependent exoDNAse (exonuclease V) beta subunit